MEHLFKVGEYSEKLPSPRLFPMQGATIMAFKDCPGIFGDGFILDLFVPDSDRERLVEKTIRWVDRAVVTGILKGVIKATVLLSKPEYIYVDTHLSYILLAPNIKPIGIQVKYYEYFRNRYPDCKFYTDGEPLTVLSIKAEDKVVGLCMPIVLPQDKIKEEIQ